MTFSADLGVNPGTNQPHARPEMKESMLNETEVRVQEEQNLKGKFYLLMSISPYSTAKP